MKKIITIAIFFLLTSTANAQFWGNGGVYNPPVASTQTFSAIPANMSTNVQDAITKASTFRHAYCSDHSAHSIYSAAGWTVAPTAETTLATCTITGGDMGLGSFRVDPLITYQNSANNKTIKVVHGGTGVIYSNVFTTSRDLKLFLTVYNRTASSQIAFANNGGSQASGIGFTTSAPYSGNINTALDQAVIITAQTTTETGVQTTSLSGDGSTCTAVKASHGYLSGEYIQVSSGSNCDTSGNPNTTIAQIATAVTNTFTYPCSCSGAESGTQPTAYRYSNIQLEAYDLEISKP